MPVPIGFSLKPLFCYQKVSSKTLYNPSFSIYFINYQFVNLVRQALRFPKLEKHDIAEPGNIMKMDHVEFRKRKQALYQIAHNVEDYEFDEFRKRVVELAEYLARELEGHIFKEDNIIYQIALQTLTSQEWQEVKKECDKIGYCCFTPENQG